MEVWLAPRNGEWVVFLFSFFLWSLWFSVMKIGPRSPVPWPNLALGGQQQGMPFHGTELNLVLRWTQDEVARFAKELAEFRARSAASLARCSIGGRDDAERRKLLGATGQVQQFGRDLVDTTRNQVAHDFVPSFTEFFFLYRVLQDSARFDLCRQDVA